MRRDELLKSWPTKQEMNIEEYLYEEKILNIPDEILDDLEEAHEAYPEQYRNPVEGGWTRHEVLSTWLRWQGIIGYTSRVMEILEAS